MVEFLGGMAGAALAAAVTLVGLRYAVPLLRKAFLDPKKFPLDRDPYLNREYAKPENRPEKSAAA